MDGELLLITEAGYPWSIGGVSTWIEDLVGGMPEQPVTVLGLRFGAPDDAPELPALPAHVRFIDLALRPRTDALDVITCALDAVAGTRTTVVHTTSTGLAGLVGMEAAREHDAPLVVTEHGIAWIEGQSGLHGNSPNSGPAMTSWPSSTPAGDPGRSNQGGGNKGNEGGGNQGGGNQGGGNQGGGNQGGGNPNPGGGNPNPGGGNPGQGGGSGGGNTSVLFWDPGARVLAHRIYKQAARITSVSHANVALQRRLVAASVPIEVIPNGVDPLPRRGRPRRRPRTVVYVGRISPEKGVDRFIEAAARLGTADRQLRFEVRGPFSDPDFAATCQLLAGLSGLGDRITFTGPLPRREALAGADLLLLPSRLEACPYALLEARAAGIPAVTADVGDCARILAGGGIAVQGGTDEFVSAARRLLEPEMYAATVRAARARPWLTVAEMVARYRAVYDAATAERRVRRRA